METTPEILQNLDAVVFMLRNCPHDARIDDHAQALGSSPSTVELVSIYLQRCLRALGHNSAVEAPDAGTHRRIPNPGPRPHERQELNQATLERTEVMNHSSSGMVDQQTQTGPNDLPSTKRKRGGAPQDEPGPGLKKWPDLDAIRGQVAAPGEIHQLLVSAAGEYASKTPAMIYLTRLFFHFAGPYAFKTVGIVLSKLYNTTEIDYQSLRGRIQAVDEIEHVNPMVRRGLLMEIFLDRQKRTHRHEQMTSKRVDKKVLAEMMTDAYPKVKPRTEDYETKKRELQNKCNEGRNWVEAQERCPGALWLFPDNMPVKQFRNLPQDLVRIFMNFLYEHRGDFLCQIVDLLGPQMAEVVAGRFPLRPIVFNEKIAKEIKKQSVNSEYFIDLARTWVSSIAGDA